MLVSLKVSNNKLGGLIFGGMNNLSITSELYLDGNKFEGTVPRDLSGGTLMVIDLNDIELSGKLDMSLWNMSSLKVLQSCWQSYNWQNSSTNLQLYQT